MEQAIDDPEASVEFDRLCLLKEVVNFSISLPLGLPASTEVKVGLSVNILTKFSLKSLSLYSLSRR